MLENPLSQEEIDAFLSPTAGDLDDENDSLVAIVAELPRLLDEVVETASYRVLNDGTPYSMDSDEQTHFLESARRELTVAIIAGVLLGKNA